MVKSIVETSKPSKLALLLLLMLFFSISHCCVRMLSLKLFPVVCVGNLISIFL